jgi:hypothetical protein
VPTLQLWKVKRRAEQQRFQKGTADSDQVAATYHRPELTWDHFGIGSDPRFGFKLRPSEQSVTASCSLKDELTLSFLLLLVLLLLLRQHK